MNLKHQIDVARSLATCVAEAGRGVRVKHLSRQPQEPLELYEMENCPYCRLVREALTELDLDAMIYPCPKSGTRYRPLVEQLGGKQQFPYLVDPNTDIELYESTDIVEYLYQTYGGIPAPDSIRLRLQTASCMAASVTRGQKGFRLQGSEQEPAKPLELYSFEFSPFARLVREKLCELELPYLLRNCGRTKGMDWLLPPMRKALGMEYQPDQRNRVVLMDKTGMVAVPYLVDPNTGIELYDSEKILSYLEQQYG